LKILFATYPTAFHTPGGGEIQLLAYKDQLLRLGVKVDFYNQWNPQFHKYDLVHFFSCIGGSVHFCAFIKRLGLPLVVSSSLWITEATKPLYPIEEIGEIIRLADIVITNSNMESNQLSKIFNATEKKFKTILNGIDQDFEIIIPGNLFREKYEIYDEFILNVGNIEPRKNQLNLIKAMKYMPHMKLVLIGNIRDQNYFLECIKEGGTQLRYIGFLEHDSKLLKSAYSACKVFCLPSTLETPGLAALEAYAIGVPIAITAEGSTSEYFGNFVEYLYPTNVDSIFTAVNSLVSSENSFNRLRSKAPLWRDEVNKLKNLYANLIK
jgi:glycosyltransferase involved in cell wall biosynthesis